MDAVDPKTRPVINQQKKKSGCFVTIYQRIGRLFRRLRKRVAKRNAVSPLIGEHKPEPRPVDKTEIIQSFEIVKQDTPKPKESHEKEDDDVNKKQDIRNDVVVSKEKEENVDEGDKTSQQSDDVNAAEQELDKLAHNFVQGTLDKMRAMLLLEKAEQIKPREDDGGDSVYDDEDLQIKIETIEFSDDDDTFW